MTAGGTPLGLVDVGSVAVPVTDQDRAIGFYVGLLGFEVRLDAPRPWGAGCTSPHREGGWRPLVAAGDGAAAGGETGVTLTTADAEGDHRALVASGVDADEVLHWPGAPVMFGFRDQDGNVLKIMEQPAFP